MFERDTLGTDGQSEAIGLLLLVVITVILSVVIATFVFGLGDQSREELPNANFSIALDQDVPDDRIDSFGNEGEGFDTLLRVTHSNGEAIPAEQLWIRGAASLEQARSWADTNASTDLATYEPGTEIGPGDSVAVWVSRNDTVRVTWTSQTGNSSGTLRVWRGKES